MAHISEEAALEAEKEIEEVVILGVRMALAEAGFKNPTEASRAARIPPKTFNAYLTGQNSFTLRSLARFARATGLPVWDVLRRGHQAVMARKDRETEAAHSLHIIREKLRAAMREGQAEEVAAIAEELLAERERSR